MIRILLDGRPVGDGRQGIARYLFSLTPYLAAEPDLDLTVACAPRWESTFRSMGVRTVATSVAFTSPIAPFSLALIQRQVRPDVTFCPSFVPAAPSRGPLVMTLHDATHLARPRDFSPLVGIYYRAITLPAARRAHAVITVSEHSRRQLEELGGLRNVVVIHAGVAHDLFRPDGPRDPRLPPRTVLYVGGFKPHKRVELLVDALPLLSRTTLALVGDPPRALLERAKALGVRDRLAILGSLSEDALAAVYRSATVFAFPSALEGFGSPPVEAMASGTPVVATDGSSLSEIVGDAGLLFQGGSVELANEIRHLLDDPVERDRLRAAGLARAAALSYERAAALTADILRDAASFGRG